MSNAVFYCSTRLKKGASVPDSLIAAEKLNNEYISKQKGYISWKQLVDGEVWADFITFETMGDAKNFVENSCNAGELAERFYSFIELDSCRDHLFLIEKNYK
jgi:hypothetical protein